jgi:RHS repeat-associated protein
MVAAYYHHDVMGSTVAATEPGVSGAAAVFTYSEFGVPGAGSGLAYTYAGYRYDTETGLYYVNARYYNPNLGRFLQTDLIGLKGGTNLFAYVGNDPLNLTDSTGLCADSSTSNSFLGWGPSNMPGGGNTNGGVWKTASVWALYGATFPDGQQTSQLYGYVNNDDSGTLSFKMYSLGATGATTTAIASTYISQGDVGGFSVYAPPSGTNVSISMTNSLDGGFSMSATNLSANFTYSISQDESSGQFTVGYGPVISGQPMNVNQSGFMGAINNVINNANAAAAPGQEVQVVTWH